MEPQPWRVSIVPGDGLVAREGRRILVADPSEAAHERFVDHVLELCGDAELSGEALLRKVGALVTQSAPEALPSFGLVVPAGDRLGTLLVGDVHLELFGTGSQVEALHGRDATMFVDRHVTADLVRLSLSLETAAEADPRSNLSQGVIRGRGLLVVAGPDAATAEPTTIVDAVPVTPAPSAPPVVPVAPVLVPEAEPRSAPEPVPAVADGADVAVVAVQSTGTSFISISLTSDGDESPPVESATGPDQVDEPAPGGPHVQGIVCSRGHFNDPESRFCSLCGISMVQQTHRLVTGVRPPLGVIVLDDGRVFALTTNLVVGREPGLDPAVLAGYAVPLELDDPELEMSRIHARIVLDGWQVRVEDARSANGTFLATSSDGPLARLEPGVPTTIRPGSRITVGKRTLLFESHQNS